MSNAGSLIYRTDHRAIQQLPTQRQVPIPDKIIQPFPWQRAKSTILIQIIAHSLVEDYFCQQLAALFKITVRAAAQTIRLRLRHRFPSGSVVLLRGPGQLMGSATQVKVFQIHGGKPRLVHRHAKNRSKSLFCPILQNPGAEFHPRCFILPFQYKHLRTCLFQQIPQGTPGGACSHDEEFRFVFYVLQTLHTLILRNRHFSISKKLKIYRFDG